MKPNDQGQRHETGKAGGEEASASNLLPNRKGGLGATGRLSRLRGKGPLLRFVLLLTVLMIGFNAVFVVWISDSSALKSYLALNAAASAAILRVAGDDAVSDGDTLRSSRYSLQIKTGCEAIQPAMFLVFAVLTFPAGTRLLSRIPFLVVATTALLLMNLVRIVCLYYTGVYWPAAFEIMHVDVWQLFFIFLPLFLWLLWVRRWVPAASKAR